MEDELYKSVVEYVIGAIVRQRDSFIKIYQSEFSYPDIEKATQAEFIQFLIDNTRFFTNAIEWCKSQAEETFCDFVGLRLFGASYLKAFSYLASPSAVYLRIAGANNSIVGDAKVFLTRLWIRRRLAMGPYSMDLRERVAAVIDEGEGSQRQVAKRFRVSVWFVTRLLQRRRDAGTLAPKPHGGGPRPVLGFPEQVRLAMLIAEHPDATLNQLKERGGFACTLTTIWRTLRRFRLTYKKKTLHARERDDPKVQAKRRRYRRKVEQMDAKRLVFVDETGINTAMMPTHAWARRGKRAIGSVPTSWGSTTVIAALGLDGVRAPLVFPGATDTQAFQTYVDEVLAPELHPGDVVIFDNLKPHLAPHVAESIDAGGQRPAPAAVQFGLRPDRGVVVEVQRGTSSGRGAGAK